VSPLAVIEDLDVLLDGGLCIGAGGIAAVMNELVLETAPEALYRRTAEGSGLDMDKG